MIQFEGLNMECIEKIMEMDPDRFLYSDFEDTQRMHICKNALEVTDGKGNVHRIYKECYKVKNNRLIPVPSIHVFDEGINEKCVIHITEENQHGKTTLIEIEDITELINGKYKHIRDLIANAYEQGVKVKINTYFNEHKKEILSK